MRKHGSTSLNKPHHRVAAGGQHGNLHAIGIWSGLPNGSSAHSRFWGPAEVYLPPQACIARFRLLSDHEAMLLSEAPSGTEKVLLRARRTSATSRSAARFDTASLAD